jgi:hypothetical protein
MLATHNRLTMPTRRSKLHIHARRPRWTDNSTLTRSCCRSRPTPTTVAPVPPTANVATFVNPSTSFNSPRRCGGISNSSLLISDSQYVLRTIHRSATSDSLESTQSLEPYALESCLTLSRSSLSPRLFDSVRTLGLSARAGRQQV